MSSTSTWTIRPSQPGDEPELVDLFQRAFGRSITPAHWKWKLERRASPVPNDWIAAENNVPIFHSGGIPVRYQIPSGETTAMISVDTMTAPEYRRRGLLTQVAQRMYATWKEAGIQFVIGLINDQWGSRAPALGWQPLFPLRWVIRPLRPTRIVGRRLRLSRVDLGRVDGLWNYAWNRGLGHDPSIRFRLAERAGPELDALWARCADDASASIVRDSAWVGWRYLACPSFTYRVLVALRGDMAVGYSACRIEHAPRTTIGYIAEAVAQRSDPAAMDTLIGETLERLRAEGADVAAAQAPPGTWYYSMLRRAGFLWSWGDFSVQLVALDPRLPMDLLRDPRNWTMWGGDFDSI